MIFLSYASEDRTTAAALVAKLQSRGIPVWWDKEIPVGEKIDKAIDLALRRSNLAVLLWSEAYKAKDWTAYEAASARHKFPVLLGIDQLPPPYNADSPWRDLAKWDRSRELEQSALDNLAQAIEKRYYDLRKNRRRLWYTAATASALLVVVLTSMALWRVSQAINEAARLLRRVDATPTTIAKVDQTGKSGTLIVGEIQICWGTLLVEIDVKQDRIRKCSAIFPEPFADSPSVTISVQPYTKSTPIGWVVFDAESKSDGYTCDLWPVDSRQVPAMTPMESGNGVTSVSYVAIGRAKKAMLPSVGEASSKKSTYNSPLKYVNFQQPRRYAAANSAQRAGREPNRCQFQSVIPKKVADRDSAHFE